MKRIKKITLTFTALGFVVAMFATFSSCQKDSGFVSEELSYVNAGKDPIRKAQGYQTLYVASEPADDLYWPW